MIKKTPMIFISAITMLSMLLMNFLQGLTIIDDYAIMIGLFTTIWILILTIVIYHHEYKLELCVVICAMIIGGGSVYFKTCLEVEPITALGGNETAIAADVMESYKNAKGTYCYRLNVTKNVYSTDCRPLRYGLPQKFKTVMYSAVDYDIQVGDTITAKVDWNKIDSSAAFNAVDYYKQDEVYVTCFPKEILTKKVGEHNKIHTAIVNLNEKLCNMVYERIPQKQAQYICTMVLGENNRQSPTDARAMQTAGIAHIVSISGLHITIMAAFMGAALSLAKAKRRATVITIIAVWFYIALTGFHVSAIRAGVMVTLMLVGKLANRPANTLNSLFIAGLLIVLANPFAILGVGFQLSFLSTLGIVLCVNKIVGFVELRTKNKVVLFVTSSFACTFSATLFSLPVFLMQFSGISLISPIANLLIVPLATPILSIAPIYIMVAAVAKPIAVFGVVADAIGFVLSAIATLMIKLTEFFGSIKFAYLGNDSPMVVLLWIWLFAAIAFFIWNSKTIRKYKLKTTLLIGLGICAVFFAAVAITGISKNENKIEVTPIADYKEQAAVITYNGCASVVILQSEGKIFSEIYDLLEYKNIDSIESLVLMEKRTLYMSGLKALCDKKPIGEIYALEDNRVQDLIKDVPIYSLEDSSKAVSMPLPDEIALKANRNAVRIVDIANKNKMVTITNNKIIAQKEKARYLFLSDKIMNEGVHFYAEYVIIMNECANQNFLMQDNVINAAKDSYSLILE